ncbi:hypothetical protein N7528_003607 [Penicillium herquei]|nr:hypothetical protein N7528_003607 [Penicillium herquei]
MAEIDLSHLYKETSPNKARVLRIFDEALHSSHDNAATAAKLTDDLRQYFESATPESIDDDFFYSPWFMLLEIVYELPNPEHPWLDILATVYKFGEWDFDIEMRDTAHRTVTDEYFQVGDIEDLPLEINSWKMFNSFVCRLSADEQIYYCNLALAYFIIIEALEEAPGYPAKFDGNVWIAAEWLIRCGHLMYEDLGEFIPEEEQAKSYPKTGPLARGILPISLDRWRFWRTRLLELSRAKSLVGNGVKPVVEKDRKSVSEEFVPEEFMLSETTLAHVKKAIDAMDLINGEASGSMDLINEETVDAMDSVNRNADGTMSSANRWWVTQ